MIDGNPNRKTSSEISQRVKNEKNEGYKSEKIEAKNVNNQFTLAKMDVQSKSQQTSESTKSSIPLLQDKLHS